MMLLLLRMPTMMTMLTTLWSHQYHAWLLEHHPPREPEALAA